MAYVAEHAAASGGVITRVQLESFEYGGEQLKLIDQSRGIRNPRQLAATLSILSQPNGPYDDVETEDGLLRPRAVEQPPGRLVESHRWVERFGSQPVCDADERQRRDRTRIETAAAGVAPDDAAVLAVPDDLPDATAGQVLGEVRVGGVVRRQRYEAVAAKRELALEAVVIGDVEKGCGHGGSGCSVGSIRCGCSACLPGPVGRARSSPGAPRGGAGVAGQRARYFALPLLSVR